MLPGQIGFSAPPGEDALIRRISDLERTVRELGPSVAASFATTVAQLNKASVSQSNYEAFTETSPGTNSSQIPQTDRDAAIVTFTKPAWANTATVLMNARITAVGTRNAGSAFTNIVGRVNGVNSENFSSSLSVPAIGYIYDGGGAYSNTAWGISPSTLTIPFARTFAISTSTMTCSLRFSKDNTGVGHAFSFSVGATVFWSVV